MGHRQTNTLRPISKIPYKIFVYLIENNERLWKLLKYNSIDALSKPNLTKKEKIDLLYTEKGKEIDYHVFFKPLIGEEMTESSTQLRFYKAKISPDTTLDAIVVYKFDILVGSKTNLVYDEDGIPCSRLDLIEAEVIDTLNGFNDIGIGGLLFDRELSNLCVQNTGLSNSKNFFGSSFGLACHWIEINNYGC